MINVKLCQDCYDLMYDEYGDDLGFIVPFNLTIVPNEECDYEQLPDGSFQYEHRTDYESED